MSAMMQNLSKMMSGSPDIPDNIKNIMNSMKANTDSANTNTNNQNQSTTGKNFDNSSNTTNNPFENFDMNTFFKMQQIMSSMNDNQNDSRTNLLMSLKPYLKESRKNKVDQYIQLMKMGKIIEIMNPLGGDSKHV